MERGKYIVWSLIIIFLLYLSIAPLFNLAYTTNESDFFNPKYFFSWTSELITPGCEENNQCESNICIEGKCRECNSDDQCAGVCENNKCIAPKEENTIEPRSLLTIIVWIISILIILTILFFSGKAIYKKIKALPQKGKLTRAPVEDPTGDEIK
jgi:hypothetical protein